jgi:hypothetical protein
MTGSFRQRPAEPGGRQKKRLLSEPFLMRVCGADYQMRTSVIVAVKALMPSL